MKDKADAHGSPFSDTIWVDVQSSDFTGTVALTADVARSLMWQLEACLDDIDARRKEAAEQNYEVE